MSRLSAVCAENVIDFGDVVDAGDNASPIDDVHEQELRQCISGGAKEHIRLVE